jgi:hypothetical protein
MVDNKNSSVEYFNFGFGPLHVILKKNAEKDYWKRYFEWKRSFESFK